MRNRLWRQEQKRIHKLRRYVRQGITAWNKDDVMEVTRGYHHHCEIDHNGDKRHCALCDPADRQYRAMWNKQKDLAWWVAQS